MEGAPATGEFWIKSVAISEDAQKLSSSTPSIFDSAFILNAAIRDALAFLDVNLPVFAAGVSHRGPYKDGPGEINVPIAIDGMIIEPGDLVIGDWDGVLAVPFENVQEVLDLTIEKQKAEVNQMAEFELGTSDRSWVDETLKARGCKMP